jgi:perosamine synthetase
MNKLALHGGVPVLENGRGRFEWPVIDTGIRDAVMLQLETTLSIRDRSGVFEEFEERFANYHDRRYAMLSNSGTSAIMAMFEGIEIGPGARVVAPAYGFHASVSPAVYLGADVVFCDIDEQGGMSASHVLPLLDGNTRAVIVTHLWGLPTIDAHKIAKECRGKGIYLLEDCSHAHGAMLDGVRVGRIGDAAAWSLQGQKLVSGGEGGILLTDNEKLFERALLQGHYNRRTRDEISRSSHLWKYHETGLGLKLRAHPLAIAIALEQFGHLDDFLYQKNRFARLMLDGLSEYDFFRLPYVNDMMPSWYAFPLRFDSSVVAGDVGREGLVRALHAEGLSEVDIPSATGAMDELPLFRDPQSVLGKRYAFGRPLRRDVSFPVARRYANEVIKIPIWALVQDEHVMRAYVDGFRKVADHLVRWGSL